MAVFRKRATVLFPIASLFHGCRTAATVPMEIRLRVEAKRCMNSLKHEAITATGTLHEAYTACSYTSACRSSSLNILPEGRSPLLTLQEELKMDLELFMERYGTEPGKDDLTVLAPKQDDPTDQVHVYVLSQQTEHTG